MRNPLYDLPDLRFLIIIMIPAYFLENLHSAVLYHELSHTFWIAIEKKKTKVIEKF